MVRVALIVGLAACASGSQGAGTAPVTPLATPVPETVWDAGTFVIVDNQVIQPGSDETFEILETSAGYRISIDWKRPLPTGEPADGHVAFETDKRFSPIAGSDTMNRRLADRVEVTRSLLRRDPDGRLTTEQVAADGTKNVAQSQGRNDFFIGGRLTTFLVALCQAPADQTAPVVYPDKATRLDPPQPLPIPGTTRDVMYRRLTYTASQNSVVVACEAGKLAGEVTRGVTIVRRGDLALAAALAGLRP